MGAPVVSTPSTPAMNAPGSQAFYPKSPSPRRYHDLNKYEDSASQRRSLRLRFRLPRACSHREPPIGQKELGTNCGFC
jgi:hypothetical protein